MKPRRRWIFDMDGTLVDSREAVRLAYLEVGIVMPDNAWGKRWQEWLPQACEPLGLDPKRVRERKQEVYPHYVKNVTSTPLGLTFLQLFFEYRNDLPFQRQFSILTGAGCAACEALYTANLLPYMLHVHANMTRLDKANYLAHHGWGIYVDDDEETRLLVKELTTWHVLTPEEALARLSQLLAPTNDSRDWSLQEGSL